MSYKETLGHGVPLPPFFPSSPFVGEKVMNFKWGIGCLFFYFIKQLKILVQSKVWKLLKWQIRSWYYRISDDFYSIEIIPKHDAFVDDHASWLTQPYFAVQWADLKRGISKKDQGIHWASNLY